MSSEKCRTCKYVGYCAHMRCRVITECKDYEDMQSAPSFDWDLRKLAKPRDPVESDLENSR